MRRRMLRFWGSGAIIVAVGAIGDLLGASISCLEEGWWSRVLSHCWSLRWRLTLGCCAPLVVVAGRPVSDLWGAGGRGGCGDGAAGWWHRAHGA